MSSKINNPILYINGPGYSFHNFEPLIAQIEEHFESILKEINFSSPSGEKVSISLELDVFNPEKVAAVARRSNTPFSYEVHMSAGLSYQVWLASRALESEVNYISWKNEIAITDIDHTGKDIGLILADFAYFLGSYYIILHEISHIVLGHCDYAQDHMQVGELNEFSDETCKLTSDQIRIRKAFEAEADRQAGEFLCAFFDLALGESGLGEHIKFPSRERAYEFYVYSISLIFVLLQQLTQRKETIHPKPDERQYIVLSSITKYFEIHHPKQHDKIMEKVTLSSLEAGKKLGLIGADDITNKVKTAIELSFVDDVVKETNIRKYQLRLTKK